VEQFRGLSRGGQAPTGLAWKCCVLLEMNSLGNQAAGAFPNSCGISHGISRGFAFTGQIGCGAGTQDRKNDNEGEVLTAAVSQEWLPTHKAISNRKAWQASLQVASCAVVIDAKEGARDFYLKYDFQPLPSQSNRLFLPMRTIETLFSWE